VTAPSAATRHRRVAPVALTLAVATALARAAGFARTAVFGRVVGRTCVASVYAAANGVPNILFEIAAGGALSAVAVPLLARHLAAGDTDAAARTASALLTWTIATLVPLTVLAMVAAGPLIRTLLGPVAGCDRAAAVAAGTRMLVVFAVQIVLYGVGIVVGGVLQASGRFLGPAVAPLLSSVVVIGAYLVYGAGGPPLTSPDLRGLVGWREAVLAGGTTLGVAVLALGLLVPLRRTGVRLRPTWRFGPGESRAVAALAAAGLATVAAQQVATAVVIRLSSGVRADSYVLFLLASTVFLLPWAVLAVPVATSVFPRLAAARDRDDAGRIAAPAVRAVLVLMSVSAAALFAVARPIADVLLLGAPGQGNATPTALAAAVVAFAPGLLGYGVWAVGVRTLYAREAPRAAAVVTVSGWAVAIVADLVLVRGSTGETVAARLAAGQSIGLTVAGGAALVAVASATSRAAYAGMGRTVVAGLAAAALAAAVGRPVADAIGDAASGGTVLRAVAAGLAGAAAVAAVFAATLAVLDRPGLRQLVRPRAGASL
jgi:putative peptidoglycan lipid II flippase